MRAESGLNAHSLLLHGGKNVVANVKNGRTQGYVFVGNGLDRSEALDRSTPMHARLEIKL